MEFNDKIILNCPSIEEIWNREKISKPFINMVLKYIDANIQSTEKMVFQEIIFPNDIVFGYVMSEVGKHFRDNENIEVGYYKPIKNDGMVDVQFVVRNLELIKQREEKRKNKN